MDLFESGSLGGVRPEERASDAGVLLDAGRGECSGAYSDRDSHGLASAVCSDVGPAGSVAVTLPVTSIRSSPGAAEPQPFCAAGGRHTVGRLRRR